MSTTNQEPRVSVTYFGKRATIRYYDIDGECRYFHTNKKGEGLYMGPCNEFHFGIIPNRKCYPENRVVKSPEEFWLGDDRMSNKKDILWTINYYVYGAYKPGFGEYGHVFERARWLTIRQWERSWKSVVAAGIAGAST